MDPWRTAIATSDATNIWIRGHAVTSLMQGATFTDTILLLHLGGCRQRANGGCSTPC